MDGLSLLVAVMPAMGLVALCTGLALARIAGCRSSHFGAVEYLYVPCTRIRHGQSAETRRWVQAVPIVRKTAKWIYYASDSWNRREAVVGPGCISREQFEADTRCHGRGYCPYGEDRCRHGHRPGVIPIPGGHRTGSAGSRPLPC